MKYTVAILNKYGEVAFDKEFEFPDDMDEEEVVDEILYQLGQEGGTH